MSMNFKIWMMGAAAALAVAGGTACAEGELTPEGLVAKYPAGSIQSEEVAERALHEVDQQRGDVEQKYAEEQHVCYSKFFATSCLDAAKEKRRVALAQIRGVEVDANSYIRANRVVERDRQLAEKRARDAANPPKPLTEVAPKPANDQAPQDPNDLARRQAEHDARLGAQQREEAARAPERAEKVAAYNKKVADAEARQRDVAQKKAEKQKQADEKAAKAAAAGKADASKSQKPASASAAASSAVSGGSAGATPAAKP